jgi:hypothetical protein
MWQTVRREELYEQVWSVPIWTLCEQYGLSDNGLRKVCKRLNVPVPSRGYWAKVEAGRKVKRAPLPAKAERTATLFYDAEGRQVDAHFGVLNAAALESRLRPLRAARRHTRSFPRVREARRGGGHVRAGEYR